VGNKSTKGLHQTVSVRAIREVDSSKLRRFGIVALATKVFLVPLVFDYAADVPFVPPKALLSHGLSYLLAGVSLGLAIRFGRSIFVWSWIHIPVLAFLVANAAAAVFAADRFLALYGTHARMLGLGTIADWTVLYFAIVLLVRTRADVLAVVASGLGAAAIVLSYEVIQLLGRDPLSWNVDVSIRPISTIGQATSLAQYLTIVGFASFSLGVLVRGLGTRLRIGLVLCAVALIAGSVATGGRAELIGFGSASATLLGLTWVQNPSERARRVSALVALLATIGIAALVTVSPLGSRLATTLETAPSSDTSDTSDDVIARLDPSSAGRIELYTIAWQMLRERPILGYGPDNFAVGVVKYRAEDAKLVKQGVATSPHSWIAQTGATTGIIGLGSFAAIAIVAALVTMRAGFQPLAITGLVMVSAFLGTGLVTVDDIGSSWLFWAGAAAVATATANRSSAEVKPPVRESSHRRWTRATRRPSNLPLGVALLFAVTGFLLLLTTWSALDASRSERAARDARLLGKVPQAVELGLTATRADPARPEYWHDLGLAYVAAARWSEASAAFDRASHLAPYDVRHIGDLARTELILARAGDSKARELALELAETAVRVDPNNPQSHATRAVIMQGVGNLPEAARSAERAITLDPTTVNAGPYVTATQIYLALGRVSDAIRIARQGLLTVGPPVTSIELRVELARALLMSGQPREALATLDAALAIQPDNRSALLLREEVRAVLAK
jgi:O-antigen ligase/tetratricopeptide (TPR) repeat protein